MPATATRVADARARANATVARRVRAPTAARGAARTRATRELLDLAALVDVVPSDLALSDAEEALGKCAFAALSASSAAFAGKVRTRATTTRERRASDARRRRARVMRARRRDDETTTRDEDASDARRRREKTIKNTRD